jgi:hypothetical protein
MNGRRVAEIALVFHQRPRIEEAQALRGLGELLFDEKIRICAHQPFGKIVRLDHEEPVPRESPPRACDIIEQMMLRDDVENGGAHDLVRVIEAHAIQDPCTAIVSGGVEALVPERSHDLDLILRHGAERMVRMIGAARHLLGIAVTAQIGRYPVNSSASRGANLCQDKWLNGLPCIRRSGGPLPPWTVTMRAPLVLISVRLKPSNIAHAVTSEAAYRARARPSVP